ncbi:MAG TPA: PrgI family protein, partial [Actinomycetes bacterium]|nr:PrgI family protein [Actinomycetes bacterium]
MTGARIHANVDREDRLVAGLTARQLAILTVAAVAAWLGVAAARLVVPLLVALGLGWAVLAVGLALALGRRDGLSLDRLL